MTTPLDKGSGDRRSPAAKHPSPSPPYHEHDEYRLAPVSEPAPRTSSLYDVPESGEIEDPTSTFDSKGKRRKPITWEPEPVNPWRTRALVAFVVVLFAAGAAWMLWLK